MVRNGEVGVSTCTDGRTPCGVRGFKIKKESLDSETNVIRELDLRRREMKKYNYKSVESSRRQDPR